MIATAANNLNSHRTLFNLFMLPLLAAALIFGTLGFSASPAEAGSYQQGYAKGKAAGRKHGYKDGFKGAYKASYVEELILGGNSRYAARNANSGEFARGYKDGYRKGYKIGYRAGQRDGGDAGREDAKNWKEDLRDKMRECMRNGGYGC